MDGWEKKLKPGIDKLLKEDLSFVSQVSDKPITLNGYYIVSASVSALVSVLVSESMLVSMLMSKSVSESMLVSVLMLVSMSEPMSEC